MTKTIKFCFLASFILCAIFLIGCSSTSNQNTFTTLSDSMSKITETLDKIQEIKTSELIINDFMDENNLARISIQNTTENSSMTSFIAKLASLNNKIINTVDINNALKQSKKVIKKSNLRLGIVLSVSSKLQLFLSLHRHHIKMKKKITT